MRRLWSTRAGYWLCFLLGHAQPVARPEECACGASHSYVLCRRCGASVLFSKRGRR